MATDGGNAAILRRLRAMLQRQREKLAAYLDLLEREGEAIREGDAERLVSYVELEQSVLADLSTLKRVIDPLEDLYQAAYPLATAPEVAELKQTLERMGAEVLARNARNRASLRGKLDELRQEIASLRRWPLRPARAFASPPHPRLVDITT